MKRSWCMALLGCAMSPLSHALPSEVYLGAAVGAYNYQSELSVLDQNDGDNTLANYRVGNTNLSGTLLAGYLFQMNETVSLGAQIEGELIGDRQTLISSNGIDDGDTESFAISVRNKYDFGLSLLPGVTFNPTTRGFVKLGWRHGSYKFKVNAREQDGTTGTVTQTALDKNHSRNGFEYGLGLQTALTASFDLFLLASQTNYASQANLVNGNRFTSNPIVNRAQLGIVWHPEHMVTK